MRFCSGVAALFFLCPHLIYAGEPRSSSQQEWERTVEAAKKEGRLSAFLFLRDNIETAVRAFQKKYPEIQVATVTTPAPQTGPRIMAERRADKYLWDICICGPTTPYTVLYPAKALDPIKPALMLPELLDESRWWSGKHHYMDLEGRYIFVFLGTVEMPNLYYNKKLVDPKEFKSFWDLLNPKWRGKVLVIDPRQAGRQRVSARILYHIPELGPKFLTRVFTEMEVTFSRDDRQAMDWLAVGRFPLCLFCGGVTEAKTQGLPVDEFETIGWRETPTLSSGSNGTIALMNRAPHPNAARLFVNWLLSREGQIAFQKTMNAPDVIMESMRNDIPKDPIPAARRRVEGVKYVVMDTAERSDQAPVSKLLNEVIKK
jgi:iron(III) transport system substrate-binding protein